MIKRFDEFASRTPDMERLWDRLANLSQKLEVNPFYTYPIKKFMNEVEEHLEEDWPISAICERLHNLLSSFWFPISSTASALIPLDEQEKLILHLSSCLKKLYEAKPESFEEFAVFDIVVRNVSRDLKNRLQIVEKTNLNMLKKRSRRIRIKEGWPQWKKDLVTLIGIWGLFEKRRQPEFILKSGTRSFYFFDLSRPLYDPRVRGNFANLVKEGIEYYLKELEKEGVGTNDILFVDKTYGEGPGTVVLSSLPFEQSYADIQSMPAAPWFDRIRGLALKEKQVYRPIFIDTLTTTGGTLREILERLEKMGYKPGAYLVVIDRSLKGLQNMKDIKELRVFSLVSFSDLLDAGVWEPEMLLGNMDHPIHLTLDMKRDSLYEICKFYQEENLYEDLRNRFFALVDRAFNIEGNKIYGKLDVSENIEVFRNVVINLLVLSYNSLKKHLSFISKLQGMKYVEYIAEVERYNSPILNYMSELLRSKVKGNMVSVENVIDMYAVSYRNISSYILESIRMYEKMTPKEKYSDGELRTLAQKGVELLERVYRKTLESPSYAFTPKKVREQFLRLYKIYNSFNEIFGKPFDEKFLGEKFFERLITSQGRNRRK